MNETHVTHDNYCNHCWHPGTGIGSWFCCHCGTYMVNITMSACERAGERTAVGLKF